MKSIYGGLKALCQTLAIFSIALFLCSKPSYGQPPGGGPVIPPPRPLDSLKNVPVPLPSNLDDFVKDRDAAIMLGKALFWDMQVGSDGKTACASCHWHAGADARIYNTLSPPEEYKTSQPLRNSLTKLSHSDFPFIKRYNPDPNDPTDPYLNPDSLIWDRRGEVAGSKGVQKRDFTAIQLWRAAEEGTPSPDQIFSVHGQNLRTVTSRNSPTVINAVFNHRLNWDGSASYYFNGVNKYGKADPDARVYEVEKTYKTTYNYVLSLVGRYYTWTRQQVTSENESLKKTAILLDNAALASQATTPPTVSEMSWLGRPFPELGRKMLYLQPLAEQEVYFTDSVLSPYSIYFGKGLWIDYRTLIQRAFRDKYWNSSKYTADGYTQMEANFSMFWGISLLMYQSTLVSDDSPLDRFLEGDQNAISDLAKTGKFVFEGNGDPAGGCNICHSGPETTAAAIGEIIQPDGNQKQVSIMTRRPEGSPPTFLTPFNVPTLYDRGFYNLGIAPTTEDFANGSGDSFGPFSPSKRAAMGEDIGQTGAEYSLALNGQMPIAVEGTFKTPSLRNVELTGPYNHNGGRMHLEDVMKFYARGSDFNLENGPDLDQGASGIPPLRDPTLGGVPVLVEFLKSMTDTRVAYQEQQFDHPELFLPDGYYRHSGNEIIHRTIKLPAVGRYGVWAPHWGTREGKPFLPADSMLGW